MILAAAALLLTAYLLLGALDVCVHVYSLPHPGTRWAGAPIQAPHVPAHAGPALPAYHLPAHTPKHTGGHPIIREAEAA